MQTLLLLTENRLYRLLLGLEDSNLPQILADIRQAEEQLRPCPPLTAAINEKAAARHLDSNDLRELVVALHAARVDFEARPKPPFEAVNGC